MRYISTRQDPNTYSSAQVILQGLAPDGGLFVPESVPWVSKETWQGLIEASYAERALYILSLYLDFSPARLRPILAKVYGEENFNPAPAPLVQLNTYDDSAYMLELWHGPSAAFKDLALQLLPHLMQLSREDLGDKRHYSIVAATSGDTGKAAMEAFRGMDDMSIVVYYPAKGVSPIQEKQMLSAQGDNCFVYAVDGDFDLAQRQVKTIFQDKALEETLAEKNICLSSANSMNWGRLLPQIIYYASAYLDLLGQEKLEAEEVFDVVVPSGNFGNIMAAWYAKQMGVPIGNLYCASNKNKVLSDFIRTGTYDRKRSLFKTNSPSMDILVSSNIERLLFELTGHDKAKVSAWMESLQEKGTYQLDPETRRELKALFQGAYADDRLVASTIKSVYDTTDHMIDPHTAVAFAAYDLLTRKEKKEDLNKVVYVSTASIYKFPEAVAEAVFPAREVRSLSLQELIDKLETESGIELSASIERALAYSEDAGAALKREDIKASLIQSLNQLTGRDIGL